jgi:hypothetical protein
MNWDAIGAIGELVGAAAVVVTLIYLASQLRHAKTVANDTNRLTRANDLREMLHGISIDDGLRGSVMRGFGMEAYAESYANALGLSVDDARRLQYYAPYWFWLRWGQFASSTSERDVAELRNLAGAFYTLPAMRYSWDNSPVVKPLLEPAFVAFVGQVLADADSESSVSSASPPPRSSGTSPADSRHDR